MISSVHNEHYICKQCLNVFIMPLQRMAWQPAVFKHFSFLYSYHTCCIYDLILIETETK